LKFKHFVLDQTVHASLRMDLNCILSSFAGFTGINMQFILKICNSKKINQVLYEVVPAYFYL